MNFVIAIVAALQVVAGIIIYGVARSAIHEILAATVFGFGILTFAISAVILELKEIGSRIDEREKSDQVRHADTKRIADAFAKIGKKQTEAQGPRVVGNG